MKITYYLYNAFLIEAGDKKIVIDPGGLLYFFQFTSLIPKSVWKDITHIFVTHGDPDHYWHADRIAAASNAPIICNTTMIREKNGKPFLLSPRGKGLAFNQEVMNFHTLSEGETIKVDGITVTGLKASHGALPIHIGPFTKKIKPGPKERIGWGAIGFELRLDDKIIVNFGDSLLHLEAWKTIKEPDVLMIPIGGHNTMDEHEALQAVDLIKPKLVIPCHYNCPTFFTKNYNPVDVAKFKEAVEQLSIPCVILNDKDSINI